MQSLVCIVRWFLRPSAGLQPCGPGFGSRAHRLSFTQRFCSRRRSSRVPHPGAEHQATAHRQLHLGRHQLNEQLRRLVSYCHPLRAERYRRLRVTQAHTSPVRVPLPGWVSDTQCLLIPGLCSDLSESVNKGLLCLSDESIPGLSLTRGFLTASLRLHLLSSRYDKIAALSVYSVLASGWPWVCTVLDGSTCHSRGSRQCARQFARRACDFKASYGTDSCAIKLPWRTYGGCTIAGLRHWCEGQQSGADAFSIDLMKYCYLKRKSVSLGIRSVLNFAIQEYYWRCDPIKFCGETVLSPLGWVVQCRNCWAASGPQC